MIEFVEPEVLQIGRFSRNKKGPKKRRERKRVYTRLPARLRTPSMCVDPEPVFDTPKCRVEVYRAHCGEPECDFVSGRYVSTRSAVLALLGHYRWVHGWLV